MSIKVNVKLFASFQQGRFTDRSMEFAPAMTIAGVLEELGLDARAVGILLLNGVISERGAQLCEGDELAIFPMMGGG